MKKTKTALIVRFCLALTICIGCLIASNEKALAATGCYAVYMSGHHDMRPYRYGKQITDG